MNPYWLSDLAQRPGLRHTAALQLNHADKKSKIARELPQSKIKNQNSKIQNPESDPV
jgi:hypothetical protein